MLRLASIAMTGRRVLTVESDYEAATAMAHDILGSGGVLVGAVPGMPAALALLDTGLETDCIMMDARTAEASEGIDRLRNRGVELIFVTGFDDWFDDEDIEDERVSIRA